MGRPGAELGFGPREIEALPLPRLRARAGASDAERLLDELAVPEGLTRNESSFSRREVIRTLAERSGSWGACAVGELADRFLASERVVLLAPERDLPEARYTTPELLATERELLEGALERQAEGAGLVDEPIVEAVLAARPELSAEQEAMVRGLTGSGDGVQVVLGRAGSGKTYALDPAREAWQAEGYQVIGAALSARAAQELQAGSGIPSRHPGAPAGRLHAIRRARRLHAMSVVVLDEAGMVGTRDLAELARHAEAPAPSWCWWATTPSCPRSPPEDPSGPWPRAWGRSSWPTTGARSSTGSARRCWRSAQGRAHEAVAAYRAHGRIHVAEDPLAGPAALVADWLAAHRAGDDALMIAAAPRRGRALSRAARALLVEAGEVGGPARHLPYGPVSAGDRVMALRNDAGLGVQNGMRATVLGLGRDGGLRVVSDAGAIVELPRDYLDAGHLTYGYAITAHKAQGMTVDRAFVLGSAGIDRQWGYTALSRARAESHLYLAADDRALAWSGWRRRPPPRRERDALGRLARDLARDARRSLRAGDVLEREVPGPSAALGGSSSPATAERHSA